MRGKINKKNLRFVDGQIEGVIYRYVLRQEGEKNGWSYVGETATESERIKSWRNSGNHSYGGKKCAEARDKYGWRAWDYEILEKVYSDNLEELIKMLEEREGYWIKELDSVKHGFNTSKQGTGMKGVKLTDEQRRQCGDNRRGKPHSEATRKHLSDVGKGRVVNEETRAKISKGNTGKKRTEEQKRAESIRMKGRTMSPEARAKSSATKMGKKHPISAEGRARINAAIRRQRVIATNTSSGVKLEFPSMLDAAKSMKIGVGSVFNFIKTGGISKNGYRFERAA